MMNKKGLSVGRVVLILLFLSILGILIYSIILGVRNMPKPTKTTTDSSLRMVEPTDYNPIDDIYSYYIMSYKNANFTIQDAYLTNIFDYESNDLVYYYVNGYYTHNNIPNSHIEGIVNNTSGYFPKAFNANTYENKLLIGRDLYTAHDTQYNWRSWNSVRSWAICYNCNIPINAFNFTMYYNFPINSSFALYFYIYTDVGSMKFTDFNFSTSSLNYSLSGTAILSSLPNASKVLRFGFGFAQSTNTNNSAHYLPNSAGTSSSTNGINYDSNQVYVNYFNTLTDVQKDNCVYLAFNTQSFPIDYLDGYQNGYNDALNNSNVTINSLNSNILELQNQISDLNILVNSQQVTITNLQDQLNQVNNNYKGLFFTIADVPLRTVQGMLGFEVLGVNLFQFFVGVITALGMLWLIKKLI